MNMVFPDSESQKKQPSGLYHTHPGMHTLYSTHRNKHMCTLIAQKELTSKINVFKAIILIYVHYVLQRITVQMLLYIDQLCSLGW